MSSVLATIQEKAQRLSPEKQATLAEFAEFLLQKDQVVTQTEPTFDWAGRPDDEPMPLTSVELQHMATVWRIEQELDLK
jgi:hypothetical protein